ncbi:MAG: hypothetical protein F6J96_00850 [Symploca sp. SIO1C2]|nr:hypothetical protein [Symploca sp. SIO1C2]
MTSQTLTMVEAIHELPLRLLPSIGFNSSKENINHCFLTAMVLFALEYFPACG